MSSSTISFTLSANAFFFTGTASIKYSDTLPPYTNSLLPRLADHTSCKVRRREVCTPSTNKTASTSVSALWSFTSPFSPSGLTSMLLPPLPLLSLSNSSHMKLSYTEVLPAALSPSMLTFLPLKSIFKCEWHLKFESSKLISLIVFIGGITPFSFLVTVRYATYYCIVFCDLPNGSYRDYIPCYCRCGQSCIVLSGRFRHIRLL